MKEKKTRRWIFFCFDDTYCRFTHTTYDLLIQSVASSMINTITEKGVMRAEKGQEGGFLLLLAIPLMMNVLGKRFRRAGAGYNNMDHMDKNF